MLIVQDCPVSPASPAKMHNRQLCSKCCPIPEHQLPVLCMATSICAVGSCGEESAQGALNALAPLHEAKQLQINVALLLPG